MGKSGKKRSSFSKRKKAAKPQPEVFYVEKILAYKIEKDSVRFHVKWEGYPLSEATWEPLPSFSSMTPLELYLKNIKQEDVDIIVSHLPSLKSVAPTKPVLTTKKENAHTNKRKSISPPLKRQAKKPESRPNSGRKKVKQISRPSSASSIPKQKQQKLQTVEPESVTPTIVMDEYVRGTRVLCFEFKGKVLALGEPQFEKEFGSDALREYVKNSYRTTLSRPSFSPSRLRHQDPHQQYKEALAQYMKGDNKTMR